MSKQPYRTEIGMISDILRVAMDHGRQGTIITTIARNANLSHYTAMDKCQKLIDFGLIESKEYKRGNIFLITDKGMQFLSELEKFTEEAHALKIRC
ncbi:MAG: winged helix-turn-helix domain-containing protein [Nitrosotalea sp.]